MTAYAIVRLLRPDDVRSCTCSSKDDDSRRASLAHHCYLRAGGRPRTENCSNASPSDGPEVFPKTHRVGAKTRTVRIEGNLTCTLFPARPPSPALRRDADRGPRA